MILKNVIDITKFSILLLFYLLLNHNINYFYVTIHVSAKEHDFSNY